MKLKEGLSPAPACARAGGHVNSVLTCGKPLRRSSLECAFRRVPQLRNAAPGGSGKGSTRRFPPGPKPPAPVRAARIPISGLTRGWKVPFRCRMGGLRLAGIFHAPIETGTSRCVRARGLLFTPSRPPHSPPVLPAPERPRRKTKRWTLSMRRQPHKGGAGTAARGP